MQIYDSNIKAYPALGDIILRVISPNTYGYIDATGVLYACSAHFKNGLGVNVSSKGFCNAWKELLLPKGCNSCISPSGVENNLIFSLNLSSLLDCFFRMRH